MGTKSQTHLTAIRRKTVQIQNNTTKHKKQGKNVQNDNKSPARAGREEVKKMDRTTQVKVDIVGDGTQLEKVIDKLQEKANRLQSTLKEMGITVDALKDKEC